MTINSAEASEKIERGSAQSPIAASMMILKH